MSRLGLAAATAGVLLISASLGAFAQTQIQTAPPPPPIIQAPQSQALAPANTFVARANVSVANNTNVPQTVSGTGVVPFQLMPHQQANLEMRVAPPVAPGTSVPVRFEYSIGQSAGPQCRGTIDMSLDTEGQQSGRYEVTNCVAHSLGTNGGNCNIAVNAQNAMCQGGLAFSAR
ncbi:MAG TPA: hypothetical protein VKV32_17910 [Stellaceae bacterium]|nr:hypothetical protein [Stellaceae bacterium]